MPLFGGPPNVQKLKQKRNVNGLLKALDYQKDPQIQQQAAKALKAIGWKPDPDETGAWYHILLGEWDALKEIGSPAVDLLIDFIQQWPNNRLPGIRILGEIGDRRAVELLITALEDEDHDVRMLAAKALCNLPDARAIPALQAALNDDELLIRMAAQTALNAIGAAALAPMVKTLRTGETVQQRRGAAEALGEIGNTQAMEPLLVALKEDEDDSVRRAAALALGKLGDQSAVEPLREALTDQASGVREYAAVSLDTLGWKPGKDEYAAWYHVVKGDWKRCKKLGAAALQPLMKSLATVYNTKTRQSIITTLGELGDMSAVESLKPLLQDQELAVRQATVEALATLGWQPEKDELSAHYWIMQGHVAQCLQIGAPALQPLLLAVKHGNMDFRKSVAETLVQLYESGELSAEQKQHILQNRSALSYHDDTPHVDRIGKDSHTDKTERGFSPGPHTDYTPTQVTLGGVIQSSDCHQDSRPQIHTDRVTKGKHADKKHVDQGFDVHLPIT